MRIVCIGGGPAGLYFALMMKSRNPAHDVTVVERNRPNDTFGWGGVFSDQTLGNLRAADAPSADAILNAFNHWDDIEIHFGGRKVRSSGHGFCGIGRKRLLNILQARCEELGVKLVAKYLDGNPLLSNAAHLRGSSQWIRFPRVVNEDWVHWRSNADGTQTPVILMGDAAHTARFSIGSGTKLALEDSNDLANSIGAHRDALHAALEHYTQVRSVDVLRIQNAARNSTEWFEHVERYTSFEPEQFAYSLLTRSQRISHENLRERDAQYVSSIEDWLALRSGVERAPQLLSVPPIFSPFTLRGVTLNNRVVVSPMAQY